MLFTIEPISEDGTVIFLISGVGSVERITLPLLIAPTGLPFLPSVEDVDLGELFQDFDVTSTESVFGITIALEIFTEGAPVDIPLEPVPFLAFPFDESFAGKFATRGGDQLRSR